MKCPKCKEEFRLDIKAVIPNEQRMSITITLKDNSFVGAQILGDTITNMSKTLKAVAKSMGQRVEVFVYDCRFTGQKIQVDFIIVSVSKTTVNNKTKKGF